MPHYLFLLVELVLDSFTFDIFKYNFPYFFYADPIKGLVYFYNIIIYKVLFLVCEIQETELVSSFLLCNFSPRTFIGFPLMHLFSVSFFWTLLNGYCIFSSFQLPLLVFRKIIKIKLLTARRGIYFYPVVLDMSVKTLVKGKIHIKHFKDPPP